jgi:hypothetical protein
MRISLHDSSAREGRVPISPYSSSIGKQNPSAAVSVHPEEQRYFGLFREKVAYVVCDYFETPFWTRLIPQLCHHEPAIKHEVIALSALYKSSVHEASPPEEKYEYRKTAFWHQDQALGYLRDSMSGKQNFRLPLLASILLGCFEAIYGNWENAIQQLLSSQKLLKEWQAAREGGSLVGFNSSKAPIVDSEVAPALGRLEFYLMVRSHAFDSLSFESFAAICILTG